MPPKAKHAIVGASAAGRWLNCPPSVRISEFFPETPSAAAEEGTTAHAWAEKALKNDAARMPKDLEEYIYSYCDFVQDKELQKLFIEQEVNLSGYVPEGFGTVDAFGINDSTLHIFDYKHGKGIKVDAEENPQLKIYALGILDSFGFLFDKDIEKIELHIIQPRLYNFSSWEVSPADLTAWGEKTLKPLALKAFNGEGDFKPGDWCTFCRAKGVCKFRVFDALTACINLKDAGKVLDAAANAKKALADFEDHIFKEALKGERIPGYELIEKPGNRRIVDAAPILEFCKENGVDPYAVPKLRGIGEFEKLLGKKFFNENFSQCLGQSTKKELRKVEDVDLFDGIYKN